MKNAVFWDVTPCGTFKKRRFGETHRLNHQSNMNRRARNVSSNVLRLPVAANVIPSSSILVTMMMVAIQSSEISVLTKATRRDISEDRTLLVKGLHKQEQVLVSLFYSADDGPSCSYSFSGTVGQ
jgi:hypothetical protein